MIVEFITSYVTANSVYFNKVDSIFRALLEGSDLSTLLDSSVSSYRVIEAFDEDRDGWALAKTVESVEATDEQASVEGYKVYTAPTQVPGIVKAVRVMSTGPHSFGRFVDNEFVQVGTQSVNTSLTITSTAFPARIIAVLKKTGILICVVPISPSTQEFSCTGFVDQFEPQIGLYKAQANTLPILIFRTVRENSIQRIYSGPLTHASTFGNTPTALGTGVALGSRNGIPSTHMISSSPETLESIIRTTSYGVSKPLVLGPVQAFDQTARHNLCLTTGFGLWRRYRWNSSDNSPFDTMTRIGERDLLVLNSFALEVEK